MHRLSADVPFTKSALTTESVELFRLPDTAQDNDNLYSMANWAPIFLPLMDTMKLHTVVEVGSEYGGNTQILGRYCIAREVELHVVDTHPHEDAKLDGSPLIYYHQARSVDFLRTARAADVYFIDGDHNYQTVLKELTLIATASSDSQPQVLFVHDSGWPHGCVDAFYDIRTLEEPVNDYSTTNGPLPWSSELHPLGFGHGHVAYATTIGGIRNGVRAAIEDFIASTPGWKRSYFSPFYGLCIVWNEHNLLGESRLVLARIVSALSVSEPIFATLEWNRILLYLKTQMMGLEWENQQVVIKKLNAEKERVAQEWENQQVVIKKLNEERERLAQEWKDQQVVIEKLNEERERLAQEWKDQQVVIENLNAEKERLAQEWKDQQVVIENLNAEKERLAQEWKDQQQLIADVDQKLRVSGQLWQDQKEWISHLETLLCQHGIPF